MGYRDKRARAAGVTARARENINNESITRKKAGINPNAYKMLTLREMGRLYPTATYEEAFVYCGITHHGMPIEGGPYSESTETIADVLGVDPSAVRHCEAALVQKGILEQTAPATKGHAAQFQIGRHWLYPEIGADQKEAQAEAQSNFWSDEHDTPTELLRDEPDTPTELLRDEPDTQSEP